MLGAVADGVDPLVGDAGQRAVDDDPAADHQACTPGQRRGRPAAGSQHDEVGREQGAVVEPEPVVGEPDRAGAGVDLGPEAPEVAGEHAPPGLADLGVEEVVGPLDDLGQHAAHGQRASDLEAEEPASDDDGAGRSRDKCAFDQGANG